MSFFNRSVAAVAAAAFLSFGMSGNAFADGIIYAPGVDIPGQTTETGPGLSGNQGSSIVTDNSAAQNAAQQNQTADGASQSAVDTTAQLGPGGNNRQSLGGTEQSQSGDAQTATTDIETLKAKSLADPYTLFETSDPNIVVSRGRTIDRTKPMLALTYDDGPRTDVGERLMNVFEQYGQRTTFFMVGSRVASRASELQRMAASGHEVANHTYDHVYLNKADASAIQNQVAACNNIIEQACGVRPRVMRLPGGIKNETVLANVAMPIILWNIDTRDWEHRDTQKTIDAIIGKVKDGDIVLMHELYESTAAATEAVVPQLVNQGYQLVTVSELAALKGKTLANGELYYSMHN